MMKKHKKNQLNIARAGGGTGGHIFPIQSLIEYADSIPSYRSKIHQHYWFGTSKSLEEQIETALSKKIKNLTFLPLLSGKRRREKTLSALFQNILDLFKFLIGIFQALYYLWSYQIDSVFCKGGYVALPVVFAAKLLRKPIYVHESDTHPGLVNRIAAKFAKQIYTGFSQVLPGEKVVGQILSDELVVDITSAQNAPQTNILLMGGSQGAMTLYEAVLSILPDLSPADFHLTVILGKLNNQLKPDFEAFPNVEVKSFCSQKELGELYRSSDIAITRAGTTSLAEQDLFDLKLLMVPIPRTHDQFSNAKRYVNQRNGVLIDQNSSDFQTHLRTELLKLKGYKKTFSPKDLKKAIAEPKITILNDLLS